MNRKIRVIKSDQEVARKCYQEGVAKSKEITTSKIAPSVSSTHNVKFVDLNLREEYTQERLTHVEDLKKIHIRPQGFQVTKIGTTLKESEEDELNCLQKNNLHLFVWNPSYMTWIDVDVVFHRLALY